MISQLRRFVANYGLDQSTVRTDDPVALAAAVLLLEAIGQLPSIDSDTRRAHAERLRRLRPELPFAGEGACALGPADHAMIALLAGSALEPPTEPVFGSSTLTAVDPLHLVTSLPWSQPRVAAAWTHYVLLALVRDAEAFDSDEARRQVNAILSYLVAESGSSYHLIPRRCGDDRELLVATATLLPVFNYTFRPVVRETQRAEAALDQLRRSPIGPGPLSRDQLVLLDLLLASRGRVTLPQSALDRALQSAMEYVGVSHLSRTGDPGERHPEPAALTAEWMRVLVSARLQEALVEGSEAPLLARTPTIGLKPSSTKLTDRERGAVRRWLTPEIPTARATDPAPRVSVVIPCHNLGRYLPEAITSVLGQSEQHFELLVVDDGSDDELTVIVLDELQSRGVRVVAQPNQGIAAARNRGVAESSAALVCCLDADDRLLPRFLECTTGVLERRPELAFVGTWAQQIGESELVLNDGQPSLPGMLAFNRTTCTAVFRKTAWQCVGGFRGGFSFQGIEDWDFWLSLLSANFEGLTVEEPLFEYRVRAGSMSNQMYSPERWSTLVRELIQRHQPLFRDHFSEVITQLHERWAGQRPWLEERERALQWWMEQASRLELALEAARRDAAEKSAWIDELVQAKGSFDNDRSAWRRFAHDPETQATRAVPLAHTTADTRSEREAPSDALSRLTKEHISLAAEYQDPAAVLEARLRFRHEPSPALLLRNGRCGGPAPLLGLEQAVTPPTGEVPARVCIATPDIVGPVRNGGIGSAYAALAAALSASGLNVTILYTRGNHCENGSTEHWVDHYASRGIDFVALPEPEDPVDGPAEWGISYATYLWLKQRSFDVIHFPEMFGTGACTLQAKHLGLGFAETTLCVGLHSPTVWHRLENRERVDSIDDIFLDALERQSVRLADVVISPSRFLVDWIDRSGWVRPANTYVFPYATETDAPHVGARERLTQVAFFGRLESRKGLELFCDALDILEQAGGVPFESIAFLGKEGLVNGGNAVPYIEARAKRWTPRTNINTGFDRSAVVGYLTSRPVLAVMPSLSDNTPNTVIECLRAGVPFVATHVGGIPEMIEASDHARVLAAPEPSALASLIRDARNSPPQGIRAASSANAVNATWQAWHRGAVRRVVHKTAAEVSAPTEPLVSVCIATRNRPAMLTEALDSLALQTYRHFEVIVVDDGSDDAGAVAAAFQQSRLHGLSLSSTLIHEKQQFPGAARNNAAVHARGAFLLFMDDDNLAGRDEIRTLVHAAEHASLDIVTCGFRAFYQVDGAPALPTGQFIWLPVGPSLPLGMFVNSFGDTNMLVKRSAFFEVGGFDEERGAGLLEDWVFHSRAALAGKRAAALPEPLFEYRRWKGATGQDSPDHVSYVRTMQPYLQQLDPGVGLALLYASGMFRAGNRGATGNDSSQERFDSAVPVATVRRNDLTIQTQASWLENGDAMVMVAHGNDPQLLFPTLSVKSSAPLFVRIDMTPPRPTTVQLFWIGGYDPGYYEESRSVLAPVRAGRSTIIVRIPTGALAGRIRFDPGFAQGPYVLHSIEVRQEQTSSANPPSQALPTLGQALRLVYRALRRMVS